MQFGTILAFDYGLKRIGIATGEMALKQAHPLISLPNNAELFEKIFRLTEEWHPIRFVLGEPLSVKGCPNAMTEKVRVFAQHLKKKFAIPVDFIDERYTSLQAESLLKEMQVHFARQKGKIDALAAQLILQSWFDGL